MSSQRPHIILIMTDQQRWNTIRETANREPDNLNSNEEF